MVVKNPFVYTLLLGLLLRFVGVAFPAQLKMVHPVTTFFAIVIVALAMDVHLKTLMRYIRQSLFTFLLRFCIASLVMFALVQSMSDHTQMILLTIAGLPPAIANTTIARQLHLDEKLAGTLTTLLTAIYAIGVIMFLSL